MARPRFCCGPSASLPAKDEAKKGKQEYMQTNVVAPYFWKLPWRVLWEEYRSNCFLALVGKFREKHVSTQENLNSYLRLTQSSEL